jgi:hypothetical protein
MNLNCKDYQHQITLLLYDELADETRRDLEGHLRECQTCKDAFDSERAMHSALAEDAFGWDVPSDLLVESRKALADELDRTERKRSWWRMPAFSVVFTPMRLLESAALVAMGLALGVYVSNQQTRQVQTPIPTQTAEFPAIPQNGTISNLQVVNADPVTGQVEMAGEVSQPLRFKGRVDDNTVQQLLFSALRDANNPGSRLKAVEVLSQKPNNESIEEALISALVYDDDPGVRMRALEGLKTFANEQHVRAAFVHALQNDENAGIRIGAIDALTARNPKDADLVATLKEVRKRDDNPYVQNKALQFVGSQK